MAPRRRLRKSVCSRTDAAIDHMSRTLGFPEEVVRRKIKNLLEVYDGEWLFIEADNYSVLIEALVEEIKESVKEEDGSSNPAPKEAGSSNPATKEDGSSNLVDDHPICHLELINSTPQPVGNSSGSDHPVSMNIEDDGEGSKADAHPPPSVISQPPLDQNPRMGRRKPCYGWISDSENEDDFIYLTPAVRLGVSASPAATNGVSASPSATNCVLASPSAAICVSASPLAADCVSASPSATNCVSASPSAAICVSASPLAANCVSASPSATNGGVKEKKRKTSCTCVKKTFKVKAIEVVLPLEKGKRAD